MPADYQAASGFTLVELILALLVFSIVSTGVYSMFNAVTRQVSLVSVDNSLADKGQRILSFLEEDLRSAGFLLGPDAQIPYCAGADNGTGAPLPSRSPVVSFASGNPYDTLTFLTSTPIELSDASGCSKLFTPGGAESQKDCASGTTWGANGDRIDLYLTTRCAAASGGNSVAVDAGESCYNGIAPLGTTGENGHSLITFDSLPLSGSSVAAGSQQLFYTLHSLGTTLALRENLQQDIPDGSTVYGVRMYRYAVVERSLKRIAWDQACNSGPASTSDLIIAGIPAGSGGVDGLKFEFTFLDRISNALVTQGSLPPLSALKMVTVWLLLRSDRASQNYTDRGQYTLGASPDKITLGPYNDHYRRLLLHKTVEVKNLASIS